MLLTLCAVFEVHSLVGCGACISARYPRHTDRTRTHFTAVTNTRRPLHLHQLRRCFCSSKESAMVTRRAAPVPPLAFVKAKALLSVPSNSNEVSPRGGSPQSLSPRHPVSPTAAEKVSRGNTPRLEQQGTFGVIGEAVPGMGHIIATPNAPSALTRSTATIALATAVPSAVIGAADIRTKLSAFRSRSLITHCQVLCIGNSDSGAFALSSPSSSARQSSSSSGRAVANSYNTNNNTSTAPNANNASTTSIPPPILSPMATKALHNTSTQKDAKHRPASSYSSLTLAFVKVTGDRMDFLRLLLRSFLSPQSPQSLLSFPSPRRAAFPRLPPRHSPWLQC